MKAMSLFGVFVVARLLVVAGRGPPMSCWSPWAWLWQDLLTALTLAIVFKVLDGRRARVGGMDGGIDPRARPGWRECLAWGLYAIASAYTAMNVPVACILSTPLTWPLLRAARGTLADSIGYYVTPINVGRLAIVLVAACAWPVVIRAALTRLRSGEGTPNQRRVGVAARAVLAVAVACLPLGPMASRGARTLPLHRNALAALVTSALPRISAAASAADWRQSPLGDRAREDLTRYRGAASGWNVVVIHLESTGARHLAMHGAAADPTPCLTSLARQAIVFDHAYTTYPETIKSFFATQRGVLPALDAPGSVYERGGSSALARLLAERGYRTGLFHSGRFDYLGMRAVVRACGYVTMEDAGQIGGEVESSFGVDDRQTARRILDWIDEGGGAPFLVTYLPVAGHHPYDSPARGPFSQDDELGRYHNALHYSDVVMRELINGLTARRLERRTLLVVLGDHGEAFGEHPGNLGHTMYLYEENVRVPLMFVVPGVVESPVRVERTASLVDLAPTILDILAIPIPDDHQGRSLLEPQSSLALFSTDYSLGLLGLCDGRWKMIHDLDTGRSELFDLAADPLETSDLASREPQRTRVYRQHLEQWAASQKYRLEQACDAAP